METSIQAFRPGQKLRRKRQSLGLTLERVAQALQISKGYLCEIEQGKHTPGGDLRARIEFAFDIPSSDWTPEGQRAVELPR